jgi:hypothetical protein
MSIPFNEKTFVEKAGAGELKTVKLFVEAGININAKVFPDGEPEELSAVELAVKRNKKDVVEYLIEKKADVVNNNALYYAKLTGNNELMQILEKAGAKIEPDQDNTDGSGYIPFWGEGGKYGYKNKVGKIIIEPKYDYAEPFCEGLAKINMGGIKPDGYDDAIGGKWGYIDSKGKLVIPVKFDAAHFFSEGIAAVNIGGKETPFPGMMEAEGYAASEYFGGWRFIDKSGKFINEIKYDKVEDFSNGIAKVIINNEEKYIDKTGNFVVNPIVTNNLLIGVWNGIFDNKNFDIRINKQEGNILYGENTVHWNKPVSRNLTGSIEGEKIILNEPGTDKGDGKFIGTISGDGKSMSGTWQRFTGGEKKKWNVMKK